MRLNYSDDEEFSGQFGLWHANCRRSLKGKVGQRALRELEAALVAWPSKRLGRELFVERAGEACALGVLAVHRKTQAGLSLDEALAVCADVDPEESVEVGEAMGLPSLVAWAVVAQNDCVNDRVNETAEGPHRFYVYAGYTVSRSMTPEERYERVLAWVRSQLSPPPARDETGAAK